MSKLKSTIKLESTSVFPTPVSFSSIVNNSIDGDSNFGKLTLTQGATAPLSTGEISGKGKLVYVSSAATNPANAAIEIFGKSEESLLTLFPGESGMIPVSVSQGNLYAQTTFGSATLDYFVGNRGEAIGESVMIFSWDDPSTDNWTYTIMDVASPKPTKMIDTGFARADWNMYTDAIIQNKSYVLSFQNIAGEYNTYVFVNPAGEIVGEWTEDGKTYESPIGGWKFWWRTFYEQSVVRVILFDGHEIHYHDFPNADTVYPQEGEDMCSADGTIPVKVVGYNGTGYDAIFFVKGGKSTFVRSWNAYYEGIYVYTYTSYYSNFVITVDYFWPDGFRTSFSVYDLSGNLLKKMDLDLDGPLYHDWEYNFIGNSAFQAILWNGNDINTPYLMFNYNSNTGEMIGQDRSWYHERGGDYELHQLYGANYYPSYESDIDLNSMLIAFYDDTENVNGDRICPYRVNYLDLDYIIGDGGLKRHRAFYDTTAYVQLSNNDYNGLIPTGSDIHVLWSNGEFTGPLNALVLTKSEDPVSIVLANLSNFFSNDYNHQYVAIGDYHVFQYSGTGFTKYTVIKGANILDTLTLSYENFTNWNWTGNTIVFDNYLDDEFHFFNTATKRWVKFTNYYNDYNFPAYGTTVDGRTTGKLFLYQTPGYNDSNLFRGRLINNGISTNEVDMTPAGYNAQTWGWDDFIVGNKNITFAYTNPTKNNHWQIDVYDLNLKKIYTIDTETPNKNYSREVGNRILYKFQLNSPTASFYLLSDKVNRADISYVGNSPDHAINDVWYYYYY